MANELRANFNGTANIYAVIRRQADGYVWNGSAFVSWSDGSIADYDVALSSAGGDLYLASFPTSIVAGDYYVDFYKRAGATPAITDLRLDGATIHWNGATAAPGATPTAAEMVTLIKQALYANPVGVVTINVDGQTVTYSRSQAISELKFWQAEAALEGSTRPRAAWIRLDGF